jgi:molybdopterin-guanine dinucleotide biosynthesis protein A
VLFDLKPGFGPVGGIERALQIASSPLLLVVAVDMPHMTANFLQKLLAHCDRLTGVVPNLDGRLEPLAAIYPKRCHGFACDLIARSRHAACEFAVACLEENAVRTIHVAHTDVDCFANWNCPADAAGQLVVS